MSEPLTDGVRPTLSTESRPNLKDMVAEALREAIFRGDIRPKTRIDQDAIAAQMGVSKLPVREALIGLEMEGLVENIARRGAFVAELTHDDIYDHYLVFGLVSSLAAERAASRVTDLHLKELQSVLSRMDQETDPAAQASLNEQFHRVINRAANSRRLSAILRLLTQSMPREFYSHTPRWNERARADHRRIYNALKAHSPERARAAALAHVEAGAKHAVEELESAGFWSADGAR